MAIGDMKMLHDFVVKERSIMDSTPCRTSLLIGKIYILKILNGQPTVCHDIFRMQKQVFTNFCDILKENGLLRDGKK